MNKKNLDYSNEIDDIKRVQERLEHNKEKHIELPNPPTTPSHLDIRPPRSNLEQQTTGAQQDITDPWVPVSNKARLSKKRMLKKLSQDREWAGLQPHTMQDLLDEALDHIFSKYLQTD